MITYSVSCERELRDALNGIFTDYLANHNGQVVTIVSFPDSGNKILPWQRQRYWDWVGVLSESTGYTKREMHDTLKQEYLVPIYCRDNPVFRASWAKDRAGTRLSITDASPDQMSEYLGAIDIAAAEMGIALPIKATRS